MNSFIAIAVLAIIAGVFGEVAGYTAVQQQLLKGIDGTCSAKVNMSQDEIDQYHTTHFFEASLNMACYAKCFLEQVGFYKDGEIQSSYVVNTFYSKLGEKKANAVINKCIINSIKDNEHECYNPLRLMGCFADEGIDVWNLFL